MRGKSLNQWGRRYKIEMKMKFSIFRIANRHHHRHAGVRSAGGDSDGLEAYLLCCLRHHVRAGHGVDVLRGQLPSGPSADDG